MEKKSVSFDILVLKTRNIDCLRIDEPESLTHLVDGDEVIDERTEIEVVIDYPLNRPYKLTIRRTPITRWGFARAVCDTYKTIYEEEAKTSKAAEFCPTSLILNRQTTDGKYGIWGHTIHDLFLEGSYRTEDGVWHLLVGS